MRSIDPKPYLKKTRGCPRCFSRGYCKNGVRYILCPCGRQPNSTGVRLLAEQAKLDKRYEDLKAGGKW